MIKSFKRTTFTFLVVYGLLTSFFVTIPVEVFAQPPTNPPGGAPTSPPTSPPSSAAGTPCWDTNCIPIDSGVIFLLIAGALLGVKLIYNFSQKSNQ